MRGVSNSREEMSGKRYATERVIDKYSLRLHSGASRLDYEDRRGVARRRLSFNFSRSRFESSRLSRVCVHARNKRDVADPPHSRFGREAERIRQTSSVRESRKVGEKTRVSPVTSLPRPSRREENIRTRSRGPRRAVSLVFAAATRIYGPRLSLSGFFFSFYERHASHFCIITAVVIPLPRHAARSPFPFSSAVEPPQGGSPSSDP